MSLGGAFRVLGRLLDHWETEHWTISHVGTDGGVTISGEELCARVELRAPIRALLERGSDRTPADGSVAVDGDGALEYTIRAPLVPDDVSPTSPRMETTEVRTTDDGSLVVSLAVSMPISPDLEAGSEEADGELSEPVPAGDGRTRSNPGSTEAQDRGASGEQPTHRENEGGVGTEADRIERHRPEVPPFDDIAYLRDVYGAYETFAEMAAELDMDVTAETVRRYMIDAGVHEPTRYNTGPGDRDTSPATGSRQPEDGEAHEPSTGEATGDGTEDTPVVIADGIGLPEGLSADEFIEIVKNSRTLYEVQREMGVGRTTARNILQEYNLLDFVMGQLALESELYVTREEVVDRIRESVSG